MSNGRFLYTFKFDGATISASSEVSGLPAANVTQEFVGKVWRSTADTGQWVKFDLGTAKKITMVAVFGHNLSAGAVVTLQANDADAWENPAYSAALASTSSAIVHFLDKTYRWWRITVEDGANADGYIEIGRICAGEYYEPGVNFQESVKKSLVDPSTVEEADGRQEWTVERTKYRTYAVQFGDISAAQQGELETMFRVVGITRPLVFALDPDVAPETETIYCKIKGSLSRAMKALGYGDVPLSFEEKVS
jgi:hypothetical protein